MGGRPDLVPAYATLIVLNETADQLGNMIKRAGGLYMKPVISESLNNTLCNLLAGSDGDVELEA